MSNTSAKNSSNNNATSSGAHSLKDGDNRVVGQSGSGSHTVAATTMSVGHVKSIVTPGILLFIDQILVGIGGWIYWLVISKLTTPSEIGNATTFYSLTMVVTAVIQLGLEYPLLKSSSSIGSFDRTRILGTTLTIEMILTAISIPILIYAASTLYGEQLTPQYLWLTVGVLALTSLGFISRFALLGISDAKNVLIYDLAGTALKFATGFILVFMGYGGIGILMSFLVYNAIVVAGALPIAKKRLMMRLGSMTFAKQIIRDGLANMPSKLSKMFVMSLSIVLLASIEGVSSADVGVFYIELMISMAAGSFASSIAYMIIPASASASSTMKSDLSAIGMRIGLSFTVPIIVALLVGSQFVLSLYGTNYLAAGIPFLILTVGVLPSSILNNLLASLNASGKSKELVIIGSVQIMTFLSAFFIMSPRYGLTGAALSILLGFIVSAILALALSKKHSHIRFILVSSLSILLGWSCGYGIQTLANVHHPAIVIPVSLGITLAILVGMKNISYSDIKTILGARGAQSDAIVGIRNTELNPDNDPERSSNYLRKGRNVNAGINAKRKASYLMLGNYGNFNIGDETLLRAAIRDIRKANGKDIAFFIPTRNTEFVDIYHKNDAHLMIPLSLDNPLAILKAFIKSNAIVIGGGGIWSGYTGPLAHFIPIVTIAGGILGKRVEFRAIGLYSTASAIDKLLVNLAALLSNSCTVRDNESYQLMWKINKKKVTRVDDLAIQYLRSISPDEMVNEKSSLNEQTCSVLSSQKEQNKIIIGISVKPLNKNDTTKKIIDEFSSSINILNSKFPNKIHFVFFPFAKTHSTVESDEELTRAILASLDSRDNVSVLEHADPLSWFVTMKDYVDLFIGMRFHSIIFASEARKPILCVPYEKKITEFLKNSVSDAGISVMPLNGIDSSTIVNFVEAQINIIIHGKTEK